MNTRTEIDAIVDRLGDINARLCAIDSWLKRMPSRLQIAGMTLAVNAASLAMALVLVALISPR